MAIESGTYIAKWNNDALNNMNIRDTGKFICEVVDKKQILLIGIEEPFYLCDVELIKEIEL